MNGNFALDHTQADLIAKAAKGDHSAQRALAKIASADLHAAIESGGDADLCAYEALFWSRLAASDGDDHDLAYLAASAAWTGDCLVLAGRVALGTGMQAEALSITELLAERGNEAAALAANKAVGELSGHIIQMAKELRKEATL